MVQETKRGPGAYRSIEASLARQSFREIIDEATSEGRRIVITRHGRPVAALVSMRDIKRLQQQDIETVARMRERRGPAGDVVDFEEFAAQAVAGPRREDRPGSEERTVEVAPAEVAVGQAADMIAGEFMVQFLGPQVTEQAHALILDMIRNIVGEVDTVSPWHFEQLRAKIIASLEAHVANMAKVNA